MAGSAEPKIIGHDCFIMSREITNSTMPLFWFISRLYREIKTSNKFIQETQDRINKAIKQLEDKPASKENCQTLISFIEYQIAEVHYTTANIDEKDIPARNELVTKARELIETLETGVKLEESQTTSKYGPNMYGKHPWHRQDEKYDWNTLEGYLMCHEREFSTPTYTLTDFLNSGYFKHCLMKGWSKEESASTFTRLYQKAL